MEERQRWSKIRRVDVPKVGNSTNGIKGIFKDMIQYYQNYRAHCIAENLGTEHSTPRHVLAMLLS